MATGGNSGSGGNKGGGNKGGANKGGNKGGGNKLAGPGVPLNSPILGTGPLTGQPQYDAAKAIADAQTVGPINDLARQIAANNRQTGAVEKLTGGYFKGLEGAAQQGYLDTGKVANQLNSQLAGIGQNTQTQLAGFGQDAATAMNKYTADAASAAPGMQALTSELARQQGLATQRSAANETYGAMQGANYRDLAASAKGTTALTGVTQLGNLATAGRLENQPLTSKQADLRQTHGALLANALGSIHQQNITNAITEQGLNLRGAQITATSQNERANRRFTAHQNKLDRAAATKRERIIQRNENKRSAASHQANTARRSVAAGSKPGLTPYEQRQTEREFGLAVAYVQVNKHKGFSAQEITNNAPNVLKAGYDPLLVQAALEYVQGGGSITTRTAALLHQQGVRHLSWTGTPVTVRRSGPSPSASVGGVTSAGQGAAGGIGSVAG